MAEEWKARCLDWLEGWSLQDRERLMACASATVDAVREMAVATQDTGELMAARLRAVNAEQEAVALRREILELRRTLAARETPQEEADRLEEFVAGAEAVAPVLAPDPPPNGNGPALTLPVRTCDDCGTEFTPRRKNSRFCTARCSARHHQQRKRGSKRAPDRTRVGATAICAECGKEFTATKCTARFCSAKCCSRYASRQRRTRMVAAAPPKAEPAPEPAPALTFEPRACAECGKEFAPKLRAQRFCSITCGNSEAQRRHSAQTAPHKPEPAPAEGDPVAEYREYLAAGYPITQDFEFLLADRFHLHRARVIEIRDQCLAERRGRQLRSCRECGGTFEVEGRGGTNVCPGCSRFGAAVEESIPIPA